MPNLGLRATSRRRLNCSNPYRRFAGTAERRIAYGEVQQDVRGETFFLHPEDAPLAKRLWELRQEVLESGTPCLNLNEIRQEFQARIRPP